ncbi:PilZ domain-containing protein [Reinekea marinisedimentorum]|uniref:PilZ domain-containing protein n=1 Tax=Reinekea marinisedimentorum TaxID=230495 RepID=A0A4R3I8I8_9GAMM|nr:PilZ domain-containing protein [Reinekea marinisedimentorum]TCS42434.1 PilZ domain-containing protein [Reinekea marinisedimentorum]
MTHEKRKHLRTAIAMELQVTLEDGRQTKTKTWDISDGGIGIQLPLQGNIEWQIGMSVKTKVLGLPFDSPELTMDVVRIDGDTIGLKLNNN